VKAPPGNPYDGHTLATVIPDMEALHLAHEAVTDARCGNDWTRRFKKVADDAFLVTAGSAIIDGEIVVPAADGTTDFSVLQNELKGKSSKIVMVAFDLLYLNGHDLRKLP
jgi:bifunctional non-homologous end joining protein LigD